MKLFNPKNDLESPSPLHFYLWEKLGLIPPKGPPQLRFLYIFSSILLHSVTTIPFAIFMILYLFETNNFTEFCGCFYLVIPTISTMLKFVCTIGNIEKLHSVVKTARRLNERAIEKLEREKIERSLQLGQKISIIFFYMVLVTAGLSAIVIYKFPDIMSLWFPLDWKTNNLNFFVYYVFMIINSAMYGTINAVSNTYHGVYMCFYIGHMNCLGLRMENLVNDSKKSFNENNEKLSECIKDHQAILE